MENESKIVATVKSPTRGKPLREGRGFSLAEIKKADKSVGMLKKLNVKIDYFRDSAHDSNIEQLKNLKPLESKGEKRKPFVVKEKKRKPFKPKKDKVISKAEIVTELVAKKEITKPKIVNEEEVKTEPALAVAATTIAESKKTPLTQLSGLGSATEKKFIELGIDCVEELCKRNPEEIKQSIKGVKEDRIKKWIEEGKDLLK